MNEISDADHTLWRLTLRSSAREVVRAQRDLDLACARHRADVLDAHHAGLEVGEIAALLDLDVPAVQTFLTMAAQAR